MRAASSQGLRIPITIVRDGIKATTVIIIIIIIGIIISSIAIRQRVAAEVGAGEAVAADADPAQISAGSGSSVTMRCSTWHNQVGDQKDSSACLPDQKLIPFWRRGPNRDPCSDGPSQPKDPLESCPACLPSPGPKNHPLTATPLVEIMHSLFQMFSQ